MHYFFETLSATLESLCTLPYFEIYLKGIPIALLYAFLQLLALGVIKSASAPYLLLVSAIEWPIIVPIYFYALYQNKIKPFLIYFFNKNVWN